MAKRQYFTGICSDDTPDSEKRFLSVVTERLIAEGYFVRSGGVRGCSSPFIAGAEASLLGVDGECSGDMPEMAIYMPWGSDGERVADHKVYLDIHQLHHQKQGRYAEVSTFHRDVDLMTSHNQDLAHESYVPALLGEDLNLKSRFLICWAPSPTFDEQKQITDCGGCMSIAVRIAHYHGIRIFNTAVPEHKHRLLKWITGDKR